MNRRQKIGIWVGAILIMLMCLYPPWTASTLEGQSVSIGYQIFWKSHGLGQIDFKRLLAQCFAVLALAGAWIITNASKKKDKPKQ